MTLDAVDTTFSSCTSVWCSYGNTYVRCSMQTPSSASAPSSAKSARISTQSSSRWTEGGDHVHLLVECPPKVSVSTLVNSLKGVPSRLLRRERPDIQRRYWNGVLWSPSYFASSYGGAPISILRQYEANMPAAPALSFPAVNGEACRATWSRISALR